MATGNLDRRTNTEAEKKEDALVTDALHRVYAFRFPRQQIPGRKEKVLA